MRVHPFLLGAVAVGFFGAACGSDPTGGDKLPEPGDSSPSAGGCTSNDDCPFGQICVGGACSAEVAPPQNGVGCTVDSDCAAGELCATSTGICVTEAAAPTPVYNPAAECQLGQVRDCGSKIGACQYGSQPCVDGVWQSCIGGVTPATSESCNRLDDDCNGVLPPDEIDGDGDGFTICEGDCDDSNPSANPNGSEVCDGIDNNCDGNIDEGTNALCDDLLWCNGTESCDSVSGSCVNNGDAPDCSGLDDVCHLGVCDESADACSAQERSDGTTCDDGDPCTVDSTCTAGVCGGAAPKNCSAVLSAADVCYEAVCEAGTGTCLRVALADGTDCSDGQFCTIGDTCQTGVCTGSPRVCGDTTPGLPVYSCTGGPCNETTDSCEGTTPINEGRTCDDGNPCTLTTACNAGVCSGGTPKDCSTVADGCHAGVCNATTGVCERQFLGAGTACNDGIACTDNDACTAAERCEGQPIDCTSLNDACNNGVCSLGLCTTRPKTDGTLCSDGINCTQSDRCLSGSCVGTALDCSALSDSCNNGTCNEATGACQAAPLAPGTPCEDGLFCTAGDSCNAGSCVPGAAMDCSSLTDRCNVGTCDEAAAACVAVPSPTCCDVTIDNDFDGSNECDDCDDTNGGVFPGAPERCNGIDDDCDGLIDEDFDLDGDGYSVCAIDPLLLDCDDTNAAINPAALEDCGPTGNGNGIDENCNGYIDEICLCSTADVDGDGFSECDGDCNDTQPTVFPGAVEACDGFDTDCNAGTVENCNVSDPCNWPTAVDVCRADLLCACLIGPRGTCTGDYQCTSLCNTSQTGPVGDGCTADQTCALDLLRSANVHGCAVTPLAATNIKTGGVACSADTECRSNTCAQLFVGPGQKSYCLDYCTSDAYCTAAGTVCRIDEGVDNIDGRCWPTGRPGVGATTVGAACTSDTQCDHGHCLTDGATSYCTEGCCKDVDCPSGFTCSLLGTQVATSYVIIPQGAAACAVDTDCPTGMLCFTTDGLCAWRLSETAPMCVRDVAGQGSRQAGAACSRNDQCRSNFCEATLGVCVESCCSDATCPSGLTCELQTVQTATNLVSQGRVCMNLSTDQILSKL